MCATPCKSISLSASSTYSRALTSNGSPLESFISLKAVCIMSSLFSPCMGYGKCAKTSETSRPRRSHARKSSKKVTASGVMFEDAMDLYVLNADSTSLFLDKAPINALYATTSIFTSKLCIRSKMFDTRRRRSWTRRKVAPSRSIMEA